MYVNCDRCNNLHDDGALLQKDGKTRFICFKCDDYLQELKENEPEQYTKEYNLLFDKFENR